MCLKNVINVVFYLPAPTTMMSEGLKNIVAAMSEAGVKKISACLSGEISGVIFNLKTRLKSLAS